MLHVNRLEPRLTEKTKRYVVIDSLPEEYYDLVVSCIFEIQWVILLERVNWRMPSFMRLLTLMQRFMVILSRHQNSSFVSMKILGSRGGHSLVSVTRSYKLMWSPSDVLLLGIFERGQSGWRKNNSCLRKPRITACPKPKSSLAS